jgi:hypothetical protein
MHNLRKHFRAIRVGALVAGLLLAPITFAPGAGFKSNNACATSGCCENPVAICETSSQDYHGYENRTLWEILVGCPD